MKIARTRFFLSTKITICINKSKNMNKIHLKIKETPAQRNDKFIVTQS